MVLVDGWELMTFEPNYLERSCRKVLTTSGRKARSLPKEHKNSFWKREGFFPLFES